MISIPGSRGSNTILGANRRSNFTEGCHTQIPMPVMEIDVAGSAEQNGYFCAVPLTQLNSWLCALTATKESPAWLKSKRAEHKTNAAWDISMSQ